MDEIDSAVEKVRLLVLVLNELSTEETQTVEPVCDAKFALPVIICGTDEELPMVGIIIGAV